MNMTGNLLETIRFATDQMNGEVDSFGTPKLNLAIDMASLLWQAGEVRDQKTLIAAILSPLADSDIQAVIPQIFGDKVWSYIQASLRPEQLEVPYFQRLAMDSEREKLTAGRQILLAFWATTLTHWSRNPEVPKAEAMTRWEHAQTQLKGFAGTHPHLDKMVQAAAEEWNSIMSSTPQSS
ncbi:HD domain-containing protein [Pontibacter sp. G13]|uniref:HD domain-containing protein n=1 Tax=Pontibacter sp. G13 TaxID=3074898 RepID=UPI00288B8C3F|nr:HD domain-containing protein [Pontibacter sp. G13]WNJ21479.1 HD domain-containing protein [Pontibacter sp. G13]